MAYRRAGGNGVWKWEAGNHASENGSQERTSGNSDGPTSRIVMAFVTLVTQRNGNHLGEA